MYAGIVVGITGSAGKTSVKESLKFFLSKKFKVSASIKSYNNYLGVIISLLNIDLNSNFAIFEIGTSNFNEIKKLTSIILPEQVVITNIYPAHLENLINTRNISIEKSDIFNKNVNPNVNLAILPNENEDEKFLKKIALDNNISKIYTFGKNKYSDLSISNTKNLDKIYSKVLLKFIDEKIEIIINQDQTYKLNNILICLLFFKYNNINLNTILSLTKNIPLIKGRGLKNKLTFYGHSIFLIDESYNASPKTMENCVNFFYNLNLGKKNNKILILGDMKELGEHSLNYHIDLLNYIIKKNIENVIICGEFMQTALKKIRNNKILIINDIEKILDYMKKIIKTNDVIVIKGSNSSITNKLAIELIDRGRQ